ncbi:MAG: PKD domain-containing protein [Saprospiraceae bacterium]|nr:PKD domain-containing protein [Saprospiraceae bacterium]
MKKIKLFGVLFLLVFIISCSKDKDGSNVKASFTFNPGTGTTETIFNFDASESTNASEYRWDWDNDGVWDENYSSSSTISHKFALAGNLTVKLEVKDDDGNTNSTTQPVTINLGPAPQLTKKFYFQTKLNGNKWITFQSNDPGYSGDNIGLNTIFYTYYVGLDFETKITSSKILGLKGQTLGFDSPGIHASIINDDNGVYVGTYAAPDQIGSEFKVVDVTSDGSYMGYPSYVVEGTFKCKVDDDTHANYGEMTDGKFALRLFVKPQLDYI